MLIKLINNKNVNLITYIFVSLVTPVLIVTWKYDIFKPDTPKAVKVGLPVAVILLWFVFKFWATIHDEIRTMKEGFIREALLSIIHLGPYILLYGLGIFLDIFYKDYMFLVTVLLITQTLGVIVKARYTYLKRKELIDRGYVNVLK